MIANKNAREKVNNCEPFNGSHLFAIRENGLYVVYSYGRHWPLWVYSDSGGSSHQWYGNSEKYSVSTSRHQSQTCPSDSGIIFKTTEELKGMIRNSVVR